MSREIDKEIAIRVFKIKDSYGDRGYWWSQIKHYSTDIRAAWEVIDEMKSLGFYINIYTYKNEYHAKVFYTYSSPGCEGWLDGLGEAFKDESTPMVICKAALAALKEGK